MNLIGRLIEGMADTATAITVITIIFCEFPEKADFYNGFIMLAWTGGYIVGPVITTIFYDLVGYAGMFFLLACLIAVGALIPSVYMLPSRLNKKESEDEEDGDEKNVSYGDFLKSYRSITILIVFLLVITPLIYNDTLLAIRLMSMGMT